MMHVRFEPSNSRATRYIKFLTLAGRAEGENNVTITGTFPDIHRIDVEWTVDNEDSTLYYFKFVIDGFICNVLYPATTTIGAPDCEYLFSVVSLHSCKEFYIEVRPCDESGYYVGNKDDTYSFTLPGNLVEVEGSR